MRDEQCFRASHVISPFEQWLKLTLAELPEASKPYESASSVQPSHSDNSARMKVCDPSLVSDSKTDATNGILVHYTSQSLPEKCYKFISDEFVHCSAYRDFVWGYGSGKSSVPIINLSHILKKHPFSFERYKATDYMCLKFEDDITFGTFIRPPNPLVLRAPFMEHQNLYVLDDSHTMKKIEFEDDEFFLTKTDIDNAALWQDGDLLTWQNVNYAKLKRMKNKPHLNMENKADFQLRSMCEEGTFETKDLVRLVKNGKVVEGPINLSTYEEDDSYDIQILVPAVDTSSVEYIKVTDPIISDRHHIISNKQNVRSFRTRCVFLLPKEFDCNIMLSKGGNINVMMHTVITKSNRLVLTKVDMKGTCPLQDPSLFCGETQVFQVSVK